MLEKGKLKEVYKLDEEINKFAMCNMSELATPVYAFITFET